MRTWAVAIVLFTSTAARAQPEPTLSDPALDLDFDESEPDDDAFLELDRSDAALGADLEEGLRHPAGWGVPARIRALRSGPVDSSWLPRVSVVLRAVAIEGTALDRQASRSDRLAPLRRSELRWLVLASWGGR